VGVGFAASAPSKDAAARFHKEIAPILEKYCYDCHGNGLNKGNVTLDEFASDAELLEKRKLWLAALKNVRGGLMPPREEGAQDFRPSADEIEKLARWIKFDAFGTDPANLDPGRVTARRLNRVEYRNTIRDLMGIDFNSEVEFPPDDSGNGFDNNGDVLTVSPLLLEKYLGAAEIIVEQAVPKVAKVMRERVATGRDFRGEGRNGEQLNARTAAKVSRSFDIDTEDKYRLVMELEVRGSFDFDPGRCTVVCTIDGEERFVEDVVWHERKVLRHEFEVAWKPGRHTVAFEVRPLPPVATVANAPVGTTTPSPRELEASAAANAGAAKGAGRERAPTTFVNVRVASVQLKGPLSPEHWTTPENYARFFPEGPAPADPAARDAYAERILRAFATKAYRRPVDEKRLGQLLAIARGVYAEGGKGFEEGIGRAIMAVLASPRFLFRVEAPEPAMAQQPIALIDEFSLATRLSYFLWSTMPDDELMQLAAKGELRKQLRPQVARMLKDAKSQVFIKQFTGQWLQARDVESVPINARVVMGPNAPRNRDGRIEFDGNFRRMMRQEVEMYFDHVLREDRSVLELVDSDYTFLNDRLAQHYGIPGVTGENLRLVKLPEGSVRGGVLTMGSVLAVTSNPTRTSPVKRGLFILENILGTPPPPAPPDVPDLEESKDKFKGREPKLSEMLAVHRENKMCSSCHERMDPLGLAMENFNALGAWRERDAGQPIEPAGQLVTGEKFADVRELKKVIVQHRAEDVYHCMTEKLLTYALGRGLEYYDTQTLDDIVEKLKHADGKMSVLLYSVIESVPFQKQRTQAAPATAISFRSSDR
jgi:hypothetical protein